MFKIGDIVKDHKNLNGVDNYPLCGVVVDEDSQRLPQIKTACYRILWFSDKADKYTKYMYEDELKKVF